MESEARKEPLSLAPAVCRYLVRSAGKRAKGKAKGGKAGKGKKGKK
jgi:hypothetical protein